MSRHKDWTDGMTAQPVVFRAGGGGDVVVRAGGGGDGVPV